MQAIPVLFAVTCFLSLEVAISRPLLGGGQIGDEKSWFEEMASSMNSGYKQPIQDPLGSPMQEPQVPFPEEQAAQPEPEPPLKDVPDPAAQAGQTPGVAPQSPPVAAPQANPQPFVNPQNMFSFLFNPFGQPQYAKAPNQAQQNAFQPPNTELKNQPNAPPQPESPGSQPQPAPGQGEAFQAQSAPSPSAGGANPAFQPQPNLGFQNQQNPLFPGQTAGAFGLGQQYVVNQNPMLSELGFIDRLMRNFMCW